MTHQSFDPEPAMMLHSFEEQAWRGALARTARSTILRPLLACSFGVLMAGVLGAILMFVTTQARLPNFWTLTAAVMAGGVAAIAISILIARRISTDALKPVEMLVEQLETMAVDRFNWTEGRALTRAELDADMKLLQRRIRQIRHQSKAVAGELDRVRDQVRQQGLAKSQFLANMSHELRTPLNAILGYAMLLQEDAGEAGNATTVADLERIQQAGRTLLGLINNILDLSKIEAGKMDVQRFVIDTAVLVKAVASECGAYDGINGNSFDADIGEGAAIILGDAEKLHQCLSNLVRNALKFTQKGNIRVTVSTVDHRGAPSVEFAVSDNGPGIGVEQQQHLFAGLARIPNEQHRHSGGPGLGLTIVHRLARMMGGECLVESRMGEGSTFRLIVPIGDVTERTELTRSRSAEGSFGLMKTPSADQTILIAEDDAAALDLMQRWLSRMGFNVLSTNGSEGVVALAREHRPDIILLDALLPHRSGYQLLEDICSDPEIGHIPTILITVDDDRARGLKAGAADYLRKPITEDQLRAVLDVYRRPATGDILLIDDDDASADLLSRSVAQVGFSARRAVNGAEGLAMASNHKPQAIVLDLAMPTMDGFEVMARLAANDRLRDIPLIVVSGYDITAEDHRRLAAAGHRFFVKAVSTPREIAQSLKELVA